MDLPSGDEQSRNNIRDWEVPKRSHDDEHLNEDRNDEDERRKH